MYAFVFVVSVFVIDCECFVGKNVATTLPVNPSSINNTSNDDEVGDDNTSKLLMR